MAYTLSIPTSRDFHFVIDSSGEYPEIHRIAKGEEPQGRETFYVSFRQGTRQDGERRSEWATRRKYTMDPDTGQMVEHADFNVEVLHKMEVQLTLAGTDLKYPEVVKDKDGNIVRGEDGEPKATPKELEFVYVGSARRVKSDDQFGQWWGIMSDQWCDELYKTCLEVNPKWESKR